VSWYKETSVLFLTTCLLFLLVNLLATMILHVRDSSDPVTKKYGTTLYRVYPGLTSEEIDDLLKETWSLRTLAYEPFTSFTERPFQGSYVNVDEHRFRITNGQGPWPLNTQSYVRIRRAGQGHHRQLSSGVLRTHGTQRTVRIYNFGRAFFFSTQERLLLEKLLQSGVVPDAAVFLDGLNDFYYVGGLLEYTDTFQRLFARANDHSFLEDVSELSAVRLGHRGVRKVMQMFGRLEAEDDARNDAIRLRQVIDRYVRNKRLTEAVAAVYGIKPFFIWQPIPNYKYDLTLHLFPDHLPGDNQGSSLGYRQMADHVKDHDIGENFVWCADLQESVREPLYVDPTHYSAKMSSMVARCIADGIQRSLDLGL